MPTIPKAELTAHLKSWAAFYTYEMWMASLATAPLDDALDAVLAGPPVWVTDDPLPENDDGTECSRFSIDQLLMDAWCSGDAEIIALADHCEELGAHYLQHLDQPRPPADGSDTAQRIKPKL